MKPAAWFGLLMTQPRRRSCGPASNTNERNCVYHILGSDQKEYGPVSAAQIHQWAAEGRVHRATPARPANETEWKTLGTLPEFEKAFPPPAGLTPSTPVATENSGLATAALICGALGIVTCVTAPVGLVLGFVAHSRIRASGGRLTGSGMATTGIVLSLIAMLLGLVGLMAALLLPALARAKHKAQTIHCVSNLKHLGLAVRIYSADNNDEFPPAQKWCDAIQTSVGSPKIFQCAAAPNQSCGYAFNAKVVGKKLNEVDPQTVVIFESDAGWNMSGGPELMLSRSRHGRTFVIGFADGSVQTLTADQLSQLRWEP